MLTAVEDLLGAGTDEELYRWAVDRLVELTPATLGKVAVASDGVLVPRVSNGGATGKDHAVPIALSVPGSVLSSGDPCVITDLADVRAASAADSASAVRAHRSMVCAPIGGLGVLVGLAKSPGAFDDGDAAVACRIGTAIATAKDRVSPADDSADHLEQLLEDVRGIVSHDLQNKLSVVSGRLELAEATGNPEHFRACEQAIGGIAAIADMVETLSATGDPVRTIEPVALDAIARSTFEALDETEAALEIEAADEVLADRNCLRRLLENLFRNAVAHSSPPVTIEVGSTETGFYVADDGPGIDPMIREDVLRPAFSTAAGHQGTGLAIVRHMAGAHGWSIEITESATGGTRVELHGVDRPDAA